MVFCQCLADKLLLLATDKSQYFAQSRPVIVNYLWRCQKVVMTKKCKEVEQTLAELNSAHAVLKPIVI